MSVPYQNVENIIIFFLKSVMNLALKSCWRVLIPSCLYPCYRSSQVNVEHFDRFVMNLELKKRKMRRITIIYRKITIAMECHSLKSLPNLVTFKYSLVEVKMMTLWWASNLQGILLSCIPTVHLKFSGTQFKTVELSFL